MLLAGLKRNKCRVRKATAGERATSNLMTKATSAQAGNGGRRTVRLPQKKARNLGLRALLFYHLFYYRSQQTALIKKLPIEKTRLVSALVSGFGAATPRQAKAQHTQA